MTLDFSRFTSNLLLLPRNAKIIIAVVVDVTLCVLSIWLALYLRLGEFVALSNVTLFAAGFSIVTAVPVLFTLGLYREIFRYSGFKSLLSYFSALCIYGLIFSSLITVISIDGVPRTIGIIQTVLLFLLIGFSRVFVRFVLEGRQQFKTKVRQKALIYGAGTAGRQLANAMANSIDMKVVGFVDDDDRLHGQNLNGLPIYDSAELADLAITKDINTVLLAIPSAGRRRRNEIISKLRNVKVAVRTIPSVSDLAHGHITVSDVRELDVQDILGRETVAPDQLLLSKTVKQKSVMVTGAGGSIGSELCRQILALGPKCLLLVEQSEYALYSIHQELISRGSDVLLIPFLGSVQNENRMMEIMSNWHPETVYHAAAYKHVPIVEYNLAEGVKNNVFGTLVTARAAISQNVENFVLVSTDKAVRPTNMMGASKRLAEIILQALAAENVLTNLSIVRFGNVLGSSGSVVPKFRQQIKNGGPVTITHPEITRFFMTIPEAAQLVIQAGAMSKGGDVFVLDMGNPVKIIQLARRMIQLSGLSIANSSRPDGDITIEITGLRPGEKLYEELLIGDNAETTSHSRIMRAHEEFVSWSELDPKLKKLCNVLETNDGSAIQKSIANLVSGYKYDKDIVDCVYRKKQNRLP